MRLDLTQSIDERIEWHTEGTSGQCHAYVTEALTVDSATYQALCGRRALKEYITSGCHPPVCAGCKRIVEAAGGTVPTFQEEPG